MDSRECGRIDGGVVEGVQGAEHTVEQVVVDWRVLGVQEDVVVKDDNLGVKMSLDTRVDGGEERGWGVGEYGMLVERG